MYVRGDGLRDYYKLQPSSAIQHPAAQDGCLLLHGPHPRLLRGVA